MDVGFRSLAPILALCFIQMACNPKTTVSVFPESEKLDSSYCSGQALTTRFVVQWEDGRFSVENAPSVENFKKSFLEPNLKQIRRVEFDRVAKFAQEMSQLSEQNADPLDFWGQKMVELEAARSQEVYGKNVLIGVVDSHVDTTNAQLVDRIAYNLGEIPDNGVDDDNNGYIDDYSGHSFISNPGANPQPSDHGTHVSGIIVADPSKGYIQGVAPQAKIIPAPFIDPETGGSIGDAIMALQYVSSRGAKIINASWGGAPCMETLRNAFLELNKSGILVVVASGNEGIDIDYRPDYPAAFNMPNQITVAASTPYDFMAAWSNNGFNFVHLAAPGANILSTKSNNRLGFMSGTSMAAPFVSGAAALLWSERPQAQLIDIKTALLQSVDVTKNHEYKVQTMGRLNIRKALDEIRRLVP